MKNCLFMCCHSGFSVTPPLFVPIQCGAVLNPRVQGCQYDDQGDSISALNREYCELTAHYYAWKNITADHYGFCHYRRFFAPGSDTRRPYIVRKSLSRRGQHLLGTPVQLESLISESGIIAPRPENMGLSVMEHYCTSAHHFSGDLELFLEILLKRSPEITSAANEYLSQNSQYFCNMFIMDREHFDEYCGLLFPALAEFDSRKTRHGYFQADRTDGYLGELFTGMYITWAKQRGTKISELPRLDTECPSGKLLGYYIFPPETKIRFLAKRLAKRLKNKK